MTSLVVRRLLVGVIVMLWVVSGLPPVARAEDTETTSTSRRPVPELWALTPQDEQWALPLDALGYGDTLVATVGEPLVEVTVDVAPGLQASTFETTVEVPEHLVSVDLVAAVDGVVVDEQRVAAGTPVPWVVPIPAGGRTLTVAAREPEALVTCGVPDRPELVRLRDAALWLSGSPVPAATLADAVPTALGAIAITVPADRSPRVDDAALQLVTRLAHRLPGVQRVSITDAPAPGPRPPFVLRVTIAEAPTPSITLVDGDLVVAGSGDDLLAQVAAVGSDLLELVDGATVTAERDAVAPVTPRLGVEVPVSDIPGASTAASGARHLELAVPLDQTFFGGSVGGYTLRLGGVASPAAGSDSANVRIGLWVGDELVDLVPVGSDGRFDAQIDVPSDAIDRLTVVRLVVDGTDECDATPRLDLQLDAGAWVRAAPGQTLAEGFARFPQVAAGSLAVYPGRSLASLATTAELVVLLQEQSATLLAPTVVDRSQLLDGAGPALVVEPDGELLDTMEALVNDTGGYVAGGAIRLSADEGLGDTATLQSFASPVTGADVVVAELPAAPMGFGLADGLVGAGWDALSGTVVVVDDTGHPVPLAPGELAFVAPEPLDELATDRTTPGRMLFVQGVLGGACVVLVALTGMWIRRRVQAR